MLNSPKHSQDHGVNIKRVKNKPKMYLKKKCKCVFSRCAGVSSQARRGHQIPWSWSYRSELNSSPLLLTWEASLYPLLSPKRFCTSKTILRIAHYFKSIHICIQVKCVYTYIHVCVCKKKCSFLMLEKRIGKQTQKCMRDTNVLIVVIYRWEE